jgi:hypothetical protein
MPSTCSRPGRPSAQRDSAHSICRRPGSAARLGRPARCSLPPRTTLPPPPLPFLPLPIASPSHAPASTTMPAEDALLKRSVASFAVCTSGNLTRSVFRPGNDLGVAAHASAELLDARGFPHGPSGLYTSHVTAPYALHNLQGDAPSDFNTRQDTHTYQRLIGVQHRQLQESSHYASPINNAANSFDSTSNFTRASFGDSNTSDLSSQSAQSVRHVAGYSFSNASSPDMISGKGFLVVCPDSS